MSTTNADIEKYAKLTGHLSSAETLHLAITTNKNGLFRPKNTVGLHHLIKLGYLKPDFGHGGVRVVEDKIRYDLEKTEKISGSPVTADFVPHPAEG